MHFVDLERDQPLFTGCLPRETLCGDNPNFKVYGEVADCPILPRTTWKECSFRHYVWEIVSQNPQNSCCPSAVRGAAQIVREMNGCRRISLSQGSLYGRINRGVDEGANIEAALTAMMAEGMTPDAVIPEKNWDPRTWPADWRDAAKRYRLLEAFDCPSFDAVASAVQRGQPVVFGVFWGRGGHAITATGLRYAAGGWNLEFLNSWDVTWGDGGFGFLPEAKCSGIRTFGAFALRCMVIPSDEKLPPVAAA